MGILDVVLRPQSRLFYGFLLSSGLLAALLAVAVGRRGREVLRFVVPWRLWISRSSLLDIQLLFANAMVRAALLAPWIVSSMTVLLFIAGPMHRTFGPPEPSTAPKWLLISSFTVAVFVADDLTRFLVHRAMHRFEVLWCFHRVHHSAEVLTPLTLYRVHPIESFIMATRYAVTVGVVSAVFHYGFGGRLTQWEILGVNAITIVFTALGSNLRHSHVWLSFGPRIERWFISPAQHQLHHSASPEHFDSNFGAFLSLWDRLGGSLRTTRPQLVRGTAPLRFGLGPSKPHADHVFSAWWRPVQDALRVLFTRRRRRMRRG